MCGWQVKLYNSFVTHGPLEILSFIHSFIQGLIYTLNHKKRDILFFTITLANLNRFLYFLYHFNRDEILHTTGVKFTTSP